MIYILLQAHIVETTGLGFNLNPTVFVDHGVQGLRRGLKVLGFRV